MALEEYRKKRDFAKTPEPQGGAEATKGDSYLIQKHDASRLHYDFRLEMDGVLKSWAVPKGPSLVPGEKRLAVQTEDHPLEYGDFEGTIPKDEYGGGTVILWDRGRWEPVTDAKKGMRKGHLEFCIHGEKLSGRWHLVRMARRPREKQDNWLLIKAEDEHAREEDDPEIIDERPESVKTGRLVEDVAGETPGWSSESGRIEPKEKKDEKSSRPKKTAKKTDREAPHLPETAEKTGWPGFIEPALATLRPSAPNGAKWIHEIKFDGYRIQAHLRGGQVKFLTRSGLDWTEKFGQRIMNSLTALPVRDAIIDGELVVEGAGGASDFSALQAELSEGRHGRFIYYAFDLLYMDGHDLRPAPLIERKQVLRTLLQDSHDSLRYSEHFVENGEMVLRHACRISLEGIVSKEASSPYRSGRSRSWIKSKCAERQEFVIAGYVPSTVSDKMIGSLVLGVYEGNTLVHTGRVGTGFTSKVAADLFKRLQKLKQKESPFGKKLSAEARRGVVFTRPELVAEIEFQTWTAEGSVRHASFRGLREDRAPEDVIRESGKKMPAAKALPAVRLTHPDRIYWPDAGVTKQGLAEYFAEIWPRMAPFITNRPLALIRCPEGIEGQCFFQRHGWRGMSSEILRAADPKGDSAKHLIGIDGLAGLLGLVQGGTLEIHPWGARLDDLERPDFINMDLDPGPDIAWEQVIEAAIEVRERLEQAGLASFVKTSGGKGLHVVAPLKPRADWEKVKAFAKSIADEMAADSPERYVATISKAKRKGRILVDYLRNGRGSTAIAPWCPRARAGAPVSMPLSWEELGPEIGPDHFTINNTPNRLAALASNPWEDFTRAAEPLDWPARK
ncbi:MAG TPA: DNA ligase D [Paracoccaceae bacterium]|nr:DNA ligase D [Paracoccaceae bacterium]